MSNKKKINEKAILSELSQSSYFRHDDGEIDKKAMENKDDLQAVDKSVDSLVDESTNQSTSQPDGQPVEQSTGRQIRQPSGRSGGRPNDRSVILGKPKAFYITRKQDKDLDTLVQKLSQELEGKVNQKIDRSTVARLILDSIDPSDNQTVKGLAKQLIDQLVSQLVN